MAQWRTQLAEADASAASHAAPLGPPEIPSSGNASFDWNAFDPHRYVEDNYRQLQADDRMIVQSMRDFFCAHPGEGRRGIDVGSGANLYPALAMLPFCKTIELREFGEKNVAWLRDEVRGYSRLWDPYWDLFAARAPYNLIDHPREVLRDKARVAKQNIFKLPYREWDMGTMAFVAESISDQLREFNEAAVKFVESLKPGAPFAAAFMRNSSGYDVGSVHFPAVAIREADVQQCLVPLSHGLEITTVRSETLRREGYSNMIVALGKAGKKRT
jgi:hypothetical protein